MTRDLWFPEQTSFLGSLYTVRKHQLNVAFVSLIHNCLVAKSSLLLRFFLCQDVIFESAFTLNLSCPCHLEPFLGSRFRLHFGHCTTIGLSVLKLVNRYSLFESALISYPWVQSEGTFSFLQGAASVLPCPLLRVPAQNEVAEFRHVPCTRSTFRRSVRMISPSLLL